VTFAEFYTNQRPREFRRFIVRAAKAKYKVTTIFGGQQITDKEAESIKRSARTMYRASFALAKAEV